MAHQYQWAVVELDHEKAFAANHFLFKSMYDFILEMAFNLCDAFSQMMSICD